MKQIFHDEISPTPACRNTCLHGGFRRRQALRRAGTNDENLPHPPSPLPAPLSGARPGMGEGLPCGVVKHTPQGRGGPPPRLPKNLFGGQAQGGRRFSGDIFFVFMWILFLPLILVMLAFGCKKSDAPDRCDYDGVKIEPIYAVYFTLQDGTEKKFCSIVCASMSFSELKKKVKEVMVVDEILEKKISASRAFFVESEVVTVPHNKNRIHVFANREDALKHLQKFKGRWIENPFYL